MRIVPSNCDRGLSKGRCMLDILIDETHKGSSIPTLTVLVCGRGPACALGG